MVTNQIRARALTLVYRLLGNRQENCPESGERALQLKRPWTKRVINRGRTQAKSKYFSFLCFSKCAKSQAARLSKCFSVPHLSALPLLFIFKKTNSLVSNVSSWPVSLATANTQESRRRPEKWYNNHPQSNGLDYIAFVCLVIGQTTGQHTI